MGEDIRVKEQWQLLQNLRSTVEGLLNNGLSNVWNVYGGLNRLHNIMEQIFKHGCRIFDPTGEPDCWIFIQGLNWLQPSLATSPIIRECDDYFTNLPNRIASRKDMLWLYTSLESHSLSQKLSWLLSDKEHLLSCLEPWAFLCQETLAEATLICLKAVEKNQPALLTDIDPCLFLPNWKCGKDSPKKFHRRSSSYPVNLRSSLQEITFKTTEHACRKCKKPENLKKNFPIEKMEPTEEEMERKVRQRSLLRTWSSYPELSEKFDTFEGRCTSTENLAIIKKPERKSNQSIQKVELASVIKIDYSEAKDATSPQERKASKQKVFTRKNRSKTKNLSNSPISLKKYNSGSSDTLNYEENQKSAQTESFTFNRQSSVESSVTDSIKIETSSSSKRKASFLVGSGPEFMTPWSLKIEGQKDIRTPKKSFMEDGGSSVQPMATGYFPRPLEGQSITSFLSSAQFSRANAELDRENAHFSISEAMISAIEQVKCNRQLNSFEENVDESDEEINHLKRRIRFRRRQRQEEKRKVGVWIRDLLSDGKTDTTTTDQSISPLSSSSESQSDSIFSDDAITPSSVSGMYESTASLSSEIDYFRSSSRHGTESNLTDSIISAEGVALSLISRFSEKQLPRASELKWLVSEQDAPQQLLPLPKNWSMSLDELEESNSCQSISLRGTVEWAPPRPQIIFTPHPPPKKKTSILKQNYRCAGCGMKVAVKYANKFRYCEYLGRYFCTGCHTNQVSVIPGKILYKWDFCRYPVSNFSYRLLDQMTMDPLFQVNGLNPLLYRRVKQLERTKILRTQLFFFKDFLFNCRFAGSLQEALRKEPKHLLNDPHIYSLQDLIQVKLGVLPDELHKLIEDCYAHVADCILCQARGFMCEICNDNSKDVIYPWELNKVIRCDACGACYHINCRNNSSSKECPRCVRIQARKLSKDPL